MTEQSPTTHDQHGGSETETSNPRKIGSLLTSILPENITWRTFINLRAFGFSLIRAWTYLMFLGMAASFLSSDAASVLPPAVYISSTITLSAVLFAAALFPKQFHMFMYHPFSKALGPAAAGIGTIMVATCTIPELPGPTLGLLGGITTGFGSGLINLGYGSSYRNEDPKVTYFEVPFSYFGAALVFLLVTLLPDPLPALVIAVLPLIAGWVVFVKLKVWHPETIPNVQPVPFDVGRFAKRVGTAVLLVSIADGIIRSAFMTVTSAGPAEFYPLPMVIGSVITMGTIYVAVAINANEGLRTLYKVVVFAMAFVFLLLPVMRGNGLVEGVLVLTAYGTFNAMIWLLLSEIASVYRLSSVVVFGIGWGMISMGALIESLVGNAVSALAPFDPQTLSLLALIAVVLIFASYLFVFREKDLVEMTSVDSDDQDIQAQAEALVKECRDGAQAHNEQAKAKRAAGPMELVDRRPKFKDRCFQLAQECKLSPKETEIMILYAKGHTSTRIQEELFISRGTVTTHLRHIYQKLDVHNKQELLQLIEMGKPASNLGASNPE
ncbi:MAG: helix-turn-helix transcriptional regulator [Eggerthellales bacterium]|nr:helix-turn-helix transcriptional regulator [Eggerthellales bacterium]